MELAGRLNCHNGLANANTNGINSSYPASRNEFQNGNAGSLSKLEGEKHDEGQHKRDTTEAPVKPNDGCF